MNPSGEQAPIRINLSLERAMPPDTPSGPEAAKTQPAANGQECVSRREQLTLLLATIPDAVIITRLDGTITDRNTMTDTLLGIGGDDGVPETIGAFLPELTPPLLERVIQLLRDRQSVVLEGGARTNAGTTIPADIAVSLCGGHGEELCFIVRDTQHQRQTEETLLQMQSRMARAERLEAAGTVAGQIAHDFNNLLTPLLAYPSLIRRELTEGSPSWEFLHILEKTSEDMAHMTQQLLALSRRGNVGEELFNPNSIIQHVFALLNNGPVPDGLDMEADLADDLLTVRGGSDQMLRVIQNLCQNAVDAMEDGGTLTVRTENVYLEAPVGRYDTVEAGEYVRIMIRDTGPGIAADIREKIFDPFFTTKKLSKRRGSGLGLSIVHGIVKDHRGYVDLESELEKGTTFYLYLPVSRSDEDTPPADASLQGHGERILVIDDDPHQLRILRKIIDALSYSVTAVANGEEAIARMREQPDAFDLAVIDMCLEHGMDGCDTWIEIARIRPALPSILISGFTRPVQRVEQAQQKGAGVYLKKPLTVEKLGQAVRNAFSATTAEAAATAVEPACPTPSEPAPEPAPPDVAPDAPRLLLVDDEEPIRRLFSMLIASEIPHIEIVQAGNGEEALGSFMIQPCDVIIMDLHMPVMDGRQAFTHLRAHCEENQIPMPPVIFCTGFALPEFLKEVVSENGPHTLLRKPVRPDVLIQTIQSRLAAS